MRLPEHIPRDLQTRALCWLHSTSIRIRGVPSNRIIVPTQVAQVLPVWEAVHPHLVRRRHSEHIPLRFICIWVSISSSSGYLFFFSAYNSHVLCSSPWWWDAVVCCGYVPSCLCGASSNLCLLFSKKGVLCPVRCISSATHVSKFVRSVLVLVLRTGLAWDLIPFGYANCSFGRAHEGYLGTYVTVYWDICHKIFLLLK